MSIYSGITRKGYLTMLLASFSAILYGFDNGWWGTVLGEQAFLCAYGTATTTKGVTKCSLSTPQQSAGTGVGPAGVIIGCILSIYVQEYLGRRHGLEFTAGVSLVGILIEMTSATGAHARYWQFVAGKTINAVAMGLTANIVPIYLAETSTPRARGFVVSMYQVIQIVGIVLSAACVYGISGRTTKSAYLVPMGIQAIAPGLMLASSPFIPESPRWLVWKGRKDEAIRSATILFSAPDNAFDPVDYCTKLELAFEEEKRKHAADNWVDLFRQPDLRRVLIAVGVQSLQHAQGGTYMTNYVVSFLKGIGVVEYYPIIIALDCVYLVAVGTGYFLPDMVGRRRLLISTSALCAVGMIVTAALVTAYPVPGSAVKKLSIALIFIWEWFFGVQSPLVWILTAETAPTKNRERALAMATFGGFGVSLIITFVSPYIQNAGYGGLGSKIGFLWGAFSVIMVPFTYFFVPELKGYSLEQIDYLFAERVSARKMGSYQFRDDILATKADDDVEGDEKADKEEEAFTRVEQVSSVLPERQ